MDSAADPVTPPPSPAFLREALAAALFLTALLVLATHYHAVPARIPSPFHAGGDGNGMAGKAQLWVLLFLGWWIYLLLSLINLFGAENVHWSAPLPPGQRKAWPGRCRAFAGWFKVVFMAGLALWIWQLCTPPH